MNAPAIPKTLPSEEDIALARESVAGGRGGDRLAQSRPKQPADRLLLVGHRRRIARRRMAATCWADRTKTTTPGICDTSAVTRALASCAGEVFIARTSLGAAQCHIAVRAYPWQRETVPRSRLADRGDRPVSTCRARTRHRPRRACD